MSEIQSDLVGAVELRHSTPIIPFEANIVLKIVGDPRLEWDDNLVIMEHLQKLPATTRSVNIAIETAPHVTESSLVGLVDYWFEIAHQVLGFHVSFWAGPTKRMEDMRLSSYKLVCTGTEAISLSREQYRDIPELLWMFLIPKLSPVGVKGVFIKRGNWRRSVVLNESLLAHKENILTLCSVSATLFGFMYLCVWVRVWILYSLLPFVVYQLI